MTEKARYSRGGEGLYKSINGVVVDRVAFDEERACDIGQGIALAAFLDITREEFEEAKRQALPDRGVVREADVKRYVESLPWSEHATENEKLLVKSNIWTFWIRVCGGKIESDITPAFPVVEPVKEREGEPWLSTEFGLEPVILQLQRRLAKLEAK